MRPPADLLAEDPFARSLGVELVAEEPLTVGLDLGPDHLNFHGGVHGGVLYAVADVALSLASNRDGLTSVMVDSHLAAVKPVAAGDRVEAVVEALSEGRTIAAYRILVRRSDGVTAAAFTGTTVRL